MTIHIHHPAPLAHHTVAVAAATAALLVTGAAAGIAWHANAPASPTSTQVQKHAGPTQRMVHGFAVTQPR